MQIQLHMFSVVNFQIMSQGLCCKFSTSTGSVLQILQSLALCCKFSNLVTGFVLQILHQGLCCKFMACLELLVKIFAALQSSKIHSCKLLKFQEFEDFLYCKFCHSETGTIFPGQLALTWSLGSPLWPHSDLLFMTKTLLSRLAF